MPTSPTWTKRNCIQVVCARAQVQQPHPARVLGKETGLEATRVEQKGTMAHIWPEIHTVTSFYRVDVASGDVEMNDEHSDYRWITRDLHPFIREMITRSGIF